MKFVAAIVLMLLCSKGHAQERKGIWQMFEGREKLGAEATFFGSFMGNNYYGCGLKYGLHSDAMFFFRPIAAIGVGQGRVTDEWTGRSETFGLYYARAGTELGNSGKYLSASLSNELGLRAFVPDGVALFTFHYLSLKSGTILKHFEVSIAMGATMSTSDDLGAMVAAYVQYKF